jgi:hypothetical protein
VRALSALALLTLPLCACAPKPAAPAQAFQLDCAQPFETLKARVTAQTLTPAPKDPNEPYRFYSSPDGRISFLITEPGAPGHPAIMMQRAAGGDVKTTGCPYGDRAGYAQLQAYLDGLKTWRRK